MGSKACAESFERRKGFPKMNVPMSRKSRLPHPPVAGRVSYNGGLDLRVARLEVAVEHIQTDVSDIKDDLRDMRKEFKADVETIRKDVKTDAESLRKDIKTDVENLRKDVKADMEAMRTDIKVDMGAMRKELKYDIEGIRHGFKSDLTYEREKTTGDIHQLRGEVNEFRKDVKKDIYILWAAMLSGFLGLAGLMAKGFGWA